MSRIRSTFPTRPAPESTAWPEGVIARYMTVAGATVDLTPLDGGNVVYRCTGCGASGGSYGHIEQVAREYAQGHAEVCRALPKPEED